MTSTSGKKSTATTRNATVGKAKQVATKQRQPVSRRGRRNGKGKSRQSPVAEESDDEESDEEDEDEGEWNEEDEGDEDEEADEDEGQDGEVEQEMPAVPAGAKVPTAEEVGLSPVVCEELARHSEEVQRAHLWRLSRYSEYDIDCINSRASATSLLNNLRTTPEPVSLYLCALPQPKSSKKTRTSRKTVPTDPSRKSGRLAAHSSKSLASGSATPITSSGTPAGRNSSATTTGTSRSTTGTTTVTTTTPSAMGPEGAAATETTESTVLSTSATASSSAIDTSVATATGKTAAATASSSNSPSPNAPTPTTMTTPAAPPTATDASHSTDSATRTLAAPGTTSGAILEMSPESPPVVHDVIMLDEEGWPEWLRTGFNHMESLRMGPDFMRALEWWTVVERAYGFETSVCTSISLTSSAR